MIPEIDKKISSFYFSKSIKTGYNHLKKYVLLNIEFRQLKEAYDGTKDIKILRQIGRTDIDFFIQNFPIETDKNVSSLYKFIIKNHIENSRGQDILLNSLFNEKLEIDVKCLIVEALARPGTVGKLLVYFQQCDATIKQYFRENIPEILNSIPFEILFPIFKSQYPESPFDISFSEILSAPLFFYHRDQIIGSKQLNKKLDIDFSNDEKFKRFASKMGLTYILSSDIEKRSLYILLNFLDSPDNTSSYLLYSLVKKTVIKVHSLYPKKDNLKVGDAVILENKNIVNEIPLEKIPDSLFTQSHVVKILKPSVEGFIKNFDGGEKKKDYYFTSKFCIQFPSIVSKVKFIPGVNIKGSYDEMPFAYLVMPIN